MSAPPHESAVSPTAVTVALALVVRAGRVLVSRRRADEHMPGVWEFPGGKVKPGERAEEAARRELAEETGFEIPEGLLRPFLFVEHDYPDRRVLLLAFVATLPGRWDEGSESIRLPAGDREARWAPLAELATLEMPPANGSLVERLLREQSA